MSHLNIAADHNLGVLSGPAASARTEVLTAAAALLDIPDSALERAWVWRTGTLDIRFGLYRLLEVLLQTIAEGAPQPQSAASQVSAARWDLHGLLLPLDGVLDLASEGEWSVRQTLMHILASQRFWEWQTGYWAEKERLGLPLPIQIPREDIPEHVLPRPDETAEGDLTELRVRLDGYLDGSLANLARLERLGALDTPVSWAGGTVEVTVRFYPYRWTAHLREHTLQVEKTLELIDRRPTEVARIVRRLLALYGDLESTAGDPAALAVAAQGMRQQAEALREKALG